MHILNGRLTGFENLTLKLMHPSERKEKDREAVQKARLEQWPLGHEPRVLRTELGHQGRCSPQPHASLGAAALPHPSER